MFLLGRISRIPAYVWGLFLFLAILCVEILLDRNGTIKFKNEIDLFGIAGIPLFFVTIIELMRSHRIQAAELVRGHMSAFLMNAELYRTFHELIYDYSDADWERVKALLPKAIKINDQKTPAVVGRVWAAIDDLNHGREEGSRLYNPDFFQGSLEEKRLDSVLHFFDILAYNYRNGLIPLNNITGVAGYHLAIINTREVTSYYLSRNKEFWNKLPYEKRMRAEAPYENLRQLLQALERRNTVTFAKQLQKKPSGEIA